MKETFERFKMLGAHDDGVFQLYWRDIFACTGALARTYDPKCFKHVYEAIFVKNHWTISHDSMPLIDFKFCILQLMYLKNPHVVYS